MDGTNYILIFILLLVLFTIVVFITRWIFSITTITQNLKSQTVNIKITTRIIERLAESQGMSAEEIQKLRQQCVKEVTEL